MTQTESDHAKIHDHLQKALLSAEKELDSYARVELAIRSPLSYGHRLGLKMVSIFETTICNLEEIWHSLPQAESPQSMSAEEASELGGVHYEFQTEVRRILHRGYERWMHRYGTQPFSVADTGADADTVLETKELFYRKPDHQQILRLRAERLMNANFTDADMAERLGVDKQSIRNVLSGRTKSLREDHFNKLVEEVSKIEAEMKREALANVAGSS
ncbi:MAG: hypothetical protein ACJ74Z_06020 [Bryobacteraceae bacterium]|jgi:hypothetical protein